MAAPMRSIDYVKEGLEVVKPKLVPFAIATFVAGIVNICFLAGPVMFHNLLGMARDAKREDKAPEVGALFKFDNFLNIFLAAIFPGLFLFAVVCLCQIIPMTVVSILEMSSLAAIVSLVGGLAVLGASLVIFGVSVWTMPLVLDKQLPWLVAWKTSFRYAKGALVQHVVFNLVLGLVASCICPWVTVPIALSALWVGYEDHSAGLAEVAAEVQGGGGGGGDEE